MIKKFTIVVLLLLVFSFNNGIAYAKSTNETFTNQIKEQNRTFHSKAKIENTITKFNSYKKSTLMSKLNSEEYLLEMEPNDFPYLANYLPMDILTAGTFDTYEDIDFYEINITTSGTYLLAGAITKDSLIDLNIGLFDSYDNILDPVDYEFTDNAMVLAYNLKRGTYYAAAIDHYGLPSIWGDFYGVRVSLLDTVAPAVPTVNPIDDNDTTVTGKTEANATIYVKNGKYVIGSAKANSKGEFKVSIKPVLAKTVLKISSMDVAENVSKEKSVTVLDKTPPKITKINSVDNNDKFVKGKAEASSTITVKVGSKILGTATTNSKGDFSVSIKAQKTDTKLSFYAKDSAGNTSGASTTKVVKAK